MAIKDILTIGTDGQATAGGAGLNEQPVKNYMKTYANADATPTIAGTAIAATGNLVSVTAAHVSNLSTTLSSVVSTTLRGQNNYLTAMADTDTTGAAFYQFPAFTLDGSDIGKPISISFDVNGVTADNNWDVVVVRYTSAGVYGNILTVAGNASGSTLPSAKLPTGTATFNGFFVPDSITASDIYALRLRHRVSNAAIRLDALFVGPQPVRVGTANADAISYTPSASINQGFGTITPSLSYDRSGERIRVFGRFTCGTLAASEGRLSIPDNLTVKITQSNNLVVGRWWQDSNTGSVVKTGPILATNGQSYVKFGIDNFTSGVYAESAQLGNAIASGTGQVITVDFSTPITSWSSNVTMADRAVESYAADDGSIDVFGPSGTFVPNIAPSTGITNRDFTFQTAQNSTDSVFVEYEVGGAAGFSAGNPYPFIDGQSSFSFGMRGYWVNTTTFRVQFGNGGLAPKNGLAAAGTDSWASVSSSHKWRVRKVSAGSQVGFPISSANIVGRVDGNAPATGMVGEYSLTNSGTVTPGASTNSANKTVVSKTLGAGIWLVSGVVVLNKGTITGLTNVYVAISLTADNIDSPASNSVASHTPSTTAINPYVPTPARIINLSSTTTVYLTAGLEYTALGSATYSNNSSIQCIRIA